MSVAEDVDKLNLIAADRHDESLRQSSGASQVVLDQLCQEFATNPQETDPRVLSLSNAARAILLSYGGWCAAEAIRENSTGRVANGLSALVIEGGVSDVRDTIRALARLFHSASLLRMDTTALFDQFARMCPSERVAAEFRRFSVTPGSRSTNLRQFGYRASGTGTKFRYEENESFTSALRMYLTAPNLKLSQRVWFILRLLRHFWLQR